MAILDTAQKSVLEELFQMSGGYVLDFSDIRMEEFFRDAVGVDISSKEYDYGTGSKANRMRAFWLKGDDETVGKSIIALLEYIETKIRIGTWGRSHFPEDLIAEGKEIAEKLLGRKVQLKILGKSSPSNENGNINIILQKDVFDHVRDLLDSGNYSNAIAIEQAFKTVRDKLREITGEEKANKAFARSNYEKIFGAQPANDAERNFCEGVKHLHMSIQFFRNKLAHTPAGRTDKNIALHCIALASLAYMLIERRYLCPEKIYEKK